VAGNPTDLLVIAAPINKSGGRAGLVEVFHSPAQADVQQGYPTFLDQVSAVAGGYLERRQLKVLDAQQTTLAQVDRFSLRSP